jgi:hypothetical protein
MTLIEVISFLTTKFTKTSMSKNEILKLVEEEKIMNSLKETLNVFQKILCFRLPKKRLKT